MKAKPSQRLVLVGGGHTHVQVLRRLVMHPEPSRRVTLVIKDPTAVYSGMVPGHVAGQYSAHDISIDLVPLARRAGATVVLSPATRVDAQARAVEFGDGRPLLPWDLCSINIGSTVSGLSILGVSAHVVPTRPIDDLEPRLLERIRVSAASLLRVVVVGGGAAGCELAFAIETRMRSEGRMAHIVLLAEHGPRVRGGRRGAMLVTQRLKARGIEVRTGARVVGAESAMLRLSDDSLLPADLTLWATGAAAHRLGADSGLPIDDRGFIRTDAQLQVVGHSNLFAAGDCAVLEGGPVVPRAGVYAVRAGPILVHNLLVASDARERKSFRPQKNFLALLNTCDGRAVATRGSWAAEGPLFFRLKDWIDRSFMEKFQVLDEQGNPRVAFDAGMPSMDEEMVCGGCAAKLADEPLRAALSLLPAPPDDPDVVAGVDARDDVAVLRHQGGLLIQTVDAFPAFSGDAFLVGRVAAVNALNDVYAKGAMPRFALAVVEVPQAHGASTLAQALAGVRSVTDSLGVALVGGHTTVGEGLKIGLSVTGVPDGEHPLWPTRGAQAGMDLVLTRPLGTGVLLHAHMAGRACGSWVAALHRHLVTSNQADVTALRDFTVGAATDVTGFGLARHLLTMLASASERAIIHAERVPLLPGARTLLCSGERSSFHEQNRIEAPVLTVAPPLQRDPIVEALFDPQTAGGMLVAVPGSQSHAVVESLRAAGCDDAAVVGMIVEGGRPGPTRVEVLPWPSEQRLG
ncbi:MAG TPA: selenide, water dikinase SelD [Deltaproteobacteria bacterium]|nr:selenide, water dikinase SelD [Deltaproteobacteria bacterium]